MAQLLIGYPTIEIYCQPHVAKLLDHFLKRNGNTVLFSNHWSACLIKHMLQQHNPNWDFEPLKEKYCAKFIIEISESEMQKRGSMLSPKRTIEFNTLVDKHFEETMYYRTEMNRANGMTEEEAIYEGLKHHGLTDDDYSWEAAHMAVWRWKNKLEGK
jgi:hypothetical protein